MKNTSSLQIGSQKWQPPVFRLTAESCLVGRQKERKDAYSTSRQSDSNFLLIHQHMHYIKYIQIVKTLLQTVSIKIHHHQMITEYRVPLLKMHF